MSADDIDALRAEVLRQKLIFEAELRRQREEFDERLTYISQELADREADCRNLQSVITILGRKVDALTEEREVVVHAITKPPTPTRRIGSQDSPFRRIPSNRTAPITTSVERTRTRSITGVTTANSRRASPLIANGSTVGRSSSAVGRVPSVSALRRTESPHVLSRNASRPLLRTNTGTSSASELGASPVGRLRKPSVPRARTNSTHRLTGVKATGDW